MGRFSSDPGEDFLIGQDWMDYLFKGGDPSISDSAFVALWRKRNRPPRFLQQIDGGQRFIIGELVDGLYATSRDFDGITFRDCKFHYCDFESSSFKHASIEQSEFIGCQLRLCRFNYASLRQVSFEGSGLGSTKWGDSTLIDVSFRDANLVAASLGNAQSIQINLQGARYNKYTTWPSRDSNSRLGWGSFNPDKYGAVKVSDAGDEEWVVPGHR